MEKTNMTPQRNLGSVSKNQNINLNLYCISKPMLNLYILHPLKIPLYVRFLLLVFSTALVLFFPLSLIIVTLPLAASLEFRAFSFPNFMVWSPTHTHMAKIKQIIQGLTNFSARLDFIYYSGLFFPLKRSVFSQQPCFLLTLFLLFP